MKQWETGKQGARVRMLAALALAALTVFLGSCAPDTATPEPRSEPPVTERQAVALIQDTRESAYVTFATGYVDRRGLLDEDWVPVDVGDLVGIGQTVRTGSNSFVELLFKEFAVIRIDSDTEVRLQDFVAREDRNRVDLRLGSGSVATRVMRLTTNDRFRVGTSTAVAGVRGTSFSVHASAEGETRVTVRSGRVTVVPRAVAEIEDLLEDEADDEIREQIARIVTEIEERLVVEAREEARVDVDQLSVLEERFRQVVEEIVTVQLEAPADLTEEQTDTFRRTSVRQLVETTLSSFRLTPPQVPFVRQSASEEDLQRIEELEDRLQIDPVGPSEEEPDATAPADTVAAELPPGTESEEDVVEVVAGIQIPTPEPPVRSLPAGPAASAEPDLIPSRPEPVELRINASDVPIVGIQVRDGIIVSTDTAGTVRAHRATGDQLWAVPTANSPNENSVPVLYGNTIYFSGAREFIVVRATDGTVIHRRELDAQDAHLFGRRVISAGTRLVFPANSELRVMDADGRVSRTIPLPNPSGMTPAHHDGTLIIADTQGGIRALALADGRVVWSTQTNAIQPIAHAPAVDQSYAFLSGRRGTVVAVRIRNGEIVWERELDPGVSVGVFTDPVVTSETVFFHGGTRLFALNRANGVNRYPPMTEVTTPPLVHDGMIAFGSRTQFIVAAAANGVHQRRLSLDATPAGRPTMKEGRYVIGTQDGAILVLNPEGF